VHIVRAAPELDILDDGLTADSVRLDVMELQKPTLSTTALRPDERALASIPLPHLPPHRRRNVART
jgi:hypothetical protein